MIVAAESNFVIQLAFSQEEGGAAQAMLELAEDKKIELAIPACALFEPYQTIFRRHKKRDDLLEAFQREIKELARSSAFSDLGNASKAVTSTMAESAAIEAVDLDNAIDRVARTATIIPLTAEIVIAATTLRQLVFDLTPPDAIVFASIDSYLSSQEKGPKVFTTTNAKDFLTPEIRAHVAAYDCRVIPSFSDALAHIRNHLAL
jgi:hypothetical protein